jgi:transposase
VNRAALANFSRDDLIALVLAQHAQTAAQAEQISALSARLAELEAKLAAPPKTPDNSSLPPSKGQKPNLPDPAKKKPRPSCPGVARALAEHPDLTIEASLDACPHCQYTLSPADQPEIHAYDHIDLPPIRPIITRINHHRGVCPCCRKPVIARVPAGLELGSPFGPGISSLILHLHIPSSAFPPATPAGPWAASPRRSASSACRA